MLHIFSISLNPSSDSESSLSCVSQSIGNAVSTMFANIQFWKRFEDKQSSRCLRHQQFEVSNRLIMMTWNYIECETREVKNWVNWSPVIFLTWNQLWTGIFNMFYITGLSLTSHNISEEAFDWTSSQDKLKSLNDLHEKFLLKDFK